MDELDLAINGGTVVNADGQARANVGIRGGRIVTLPRSRWPAAR